MITALLATPLILPAPASAQTPDAYLDGAEPWTESDCAADAPIVVGADAKAQSDIYSAVTLAGVIDTDCVVLAGPRDGDMTAEQRARLDAAAAGGYVLGGIAAVPTAKIAGRDMTRLGGASRWATAQLVGRRASGDTTAGTPTTDEPADTVRTATDAQANTGGYTAVSAGQAHSCGLRADDTVTCWGSNTDFVDWRTSNETGQADAPSGSFTAVSAGGSHSCGVRSDGTVTCWGADEDGQLDVPS